MSGKQNAINRKRTSSPFNIIVKPAGPSCNLACEYCFYLEKDQFYSKDKKKYFLMQDEVLETFTRQYISSQPSRVSEINFIWQGGEPLLAGPAFYKKAVDLQKKYAPSGIKITNSIQTNGTLITEETARFLAENDFLVGISIDGPEPLHNEFRKRSDGTGTFQEVISGLENLKKHKVRFNTLTVVQSSNSKHPAEVYSFLKSAGSEFIQFIPIVEPDAAQSTCTLTGYQWGNFMNRVFDMWVKQDIGKIFIGHFDMLLGVYAGFPPGLCVHSRTCGTELAIEHNGDLYSCDHFVYPGNLLGNIADKRMPALVESSRQLKFGKDKFSKLPAKCLKCGYLNLCFGGCPKNRLIKTGTGQLNWLCEGYKMFYDHTLPYFQAMARAIENRRPAETFRQFL